MIALRYLVWEISGEHEVPVGRRYLTRWGAERRRRRELARARRDVPRWVPVWYRVAERSGP
ncbi:MAG TPA: hypothetical protein VFE14_20865 [Micromonosporaceae bacterium]|jgi:hypothetical protein|nr:hypothetical protein [Micromonosporaceae bacterium]